MRKRRPTLRERIAADRAARWQREATAGFRFATTFTIGARNYDDRFFRTLAEAEVRRDELLAENACEFPRDYYERQAHAVFMWARVSRFDGLRWCLVDASERQVLYGVDFADGTGEKVRGPGY